MLCDTRVVYEKKVKVYPEYQKNPGTQPPVQPPQAEHFSEPVQPQEQQMSSQSQTTLQQNQPYRAVPDGGYSFVKNNIEENTQEGDS